MESDLIDSPLSVAAITESFIFIILDILFEGRPSCIVKVFHDSGADRF